VARRLPVGYLDGGQCLLASALARVGTDGRRAAEDAGDEQHGPDRGPLRRARTGGLVPDQADHRRQPRPDQHSDVL